MRPNVSSSCTTAWLPAGAAWSSTWSGSTGDTPRVTSSRQGPMLTACPAPSQVTGGATPEPGAWGGPPPLAGPAAAEPLEDPLPLARRHAGAPVLDGEPHVAVVGEQPDTRHAAGVRPGILHEVGQHPLQPSLVD